MRFYWRVTIKTDGGEVHIYDNCHDLANGKSRVSSIFEGKEGHIFGVSDTNSSCAELYDNLSQWHKKQYGDRFKSLVIGIPAGHLYDENRRKNEKKEKKATVTEEHIATLAITHLLSENCKTS